MNIINKSNISLEDVYSIAQIVTSADWYRECRRDDIIDRNIRLHRYISDVVDSTEFIYLLAMNRTTRYNSLASIATAIIESIYGREWAASFLMNVVHETDNFRSLAQYQSSLKYKGRGLLMTTGRDNYNAYSMNCVRGSVNQELLATDMTHALLSAIYFYVTEVNRYKHNIIGHIRIVKGPMSTSQFVQEASTRITKFLNLKE